MKTWIMTLPLLCAVSLAMAQGVEAETNASGYPDAAVEQPAAETAAPAKAQRSGARAQTRNYGGRTLPKGDVRHCLDLQTPAGVIRCSESGKRA